jgi:hypothetical protein
MRRLSKDEIEEEIEDTMPALTNEQLAKLNAAAQAKGSMLTDDERAVLLDGKIAPRLWKGVPINITNPAPAPDVNFVRQTEDESYTARAARARAGQEARQKAHDDKIREEFSAAEKAKGSPLSFTERAFIRNEVANKVQ